MSNGDAPLTWTKKQTLVFELLSSGMKPSEIKKEHNVSYPYITLVKNAIKKGEHPPEKPEKKAKIPAKAKPSPVKTNPKSSDTVITDPLEVKADVPQSQSDVKTEVKAEGEKVEKPQQKPASSPVRQEPVAARITVQPVNIALTPTMYSMKSYLVERRGWRDDTPWEDIIDTVFAKYAKSIGLVMRGWYEIGEVIPLKPAPDNGNGQNGNEADYKKLAELVTNKIIQLAQNGQLAT